MKLVAYPVVSTLCWMSKGSCPWAVGETVGGSAVLRICLPESWHYSSSERRLVCTSLSRSLPSVPVITSEPATRPQAILTQDFESSVLMWVLEHWVRIGDPTVNTDLWCVLWVVWFCSHATQHANGGFFPESRVVVWKLNVTNNQKGSVKHLETGGWGVSS